MTYLAVPEALGRSVSNDLMNSAPLESGTFCRLHEVVRGGGRRLVLGDQIASEEPWIAQRPDLLTPSGRRISAAVSTASAEKCGLAFIHSHPNTNAAWLSPLDRRTTLRLGETLRDLIEGPFASLVISRDEWAGTVADGTALHEIERIAIAGRSLTFWGGGLQEPDAGLDDRQIRALGDASQGRLRSVKVGVVGAGGIGSPVAETLVRMGVGEILLIDHDDLDSVSNARRVFGTRRQDAELPTPRPKTEVVADALNALGLGEPVTPLVGNVLDEAVQGRLLEMDALVCGTDTHSSRAVLAELAARAVVPLIDVGVRVGTRAGSQLDAFRLERRLQVPGGPCLWCWKTISAAQVRTELLPPEEREELTREGYVTGQDGDPEPSVAALTVTAAGVATSALIGLLTGALDVAPLGAGLDGLTLEAAAFERQTADPQCICARWRKGPK